MFNVEEIELAHQKVLSGADFPKYIAEIKQLGVIAFETRVIDSCTEYFGKDAYRIASLPKYKNLVVNNDSDKIKFCHFLQIHQQGQTDYATFCQHCAETGVEKWVVSLEAMTCTYYNKAGAAILVEALPKL